MLAVAQNQLQCLKNLKEGCPSFAAQSCWAKEAQQTTGGWAFAAQSCWAKEAQQTALDIGCPKSSFRTNKFVPLP